LVLLEESNHILRKAWIFLVGSSYLECVVHSIENGSYLEKEVILNWPNVNDVFFHQQGVFKSLKKDIEIGTQEFQANFGAL